MKNNDTLVKQNKTVLSFHYITILGVNTEYEQASVN